MALKGNLHDFSITQLLNLIHLARKTGTLAIDGKSSARASFREGKLVFAQTDTVEGRLVGMLVKVGKITAEQSKKIPSNKTDRDLAAMLVQAGLLTKTELDQMVRNNVKDVVDRMFALNDGLFRFEPNVLPEDRLWAEPPINLDSIIMEGTRRLKESEKLQEELPNLDVTLRFTDRPDAKLRNVNLSVDEWRVVSYINPKNTIRQIAQANSMSELQIRKIVYAMLQAGLVEIIQPVGLPAMAAAAPGGRPATPPKAFASADEKRSVVNRLIDRIKRL
jgi:Domain of unknown function (DUF4388)